MAKKKINPERITSLRIRPKALIAWVSDGDLENQMSEKAPMMGRYGRLMGAAMWSALTGCSPRGLPACQDARGRRESRLARYGNTAHNTRGTSSRKEGAP